MYLIRQLLHIALISGSLWMTHLETRLKSILHTVQVGFGCNFSASIRRNSAPKILNNNMSKFVK
jgi:hypothetical protein